MYLEQCKCKIKRRKPVDLNDAELFFKNRKKTETQQKRNKCTTKTQQKHNKNTTKAQQKHNKNKLLCPTVKAFVLFVAGSVLL